MDKFLCYGGLVDIKELGARFLIRNNIAGNIEKYYSISERVASIINEFNKRYKFKVVQTNAFTSSHVDHLVKRFYEDVYSAIIKVKTRYKVGKKQARDYAVEKYDIGSRNARGELIIVLAERSIYGLSILSSENGLTVNGRDEVVMAKLKMNLTNLCTLRHSSKLAK